MQLFRSVAAIALCAALATPDAMAGGREPGSRLIFPVHHSGNHFTVIAVSNTNLLPANEISLGGTTFIHFEYYNTTPDADNPLLNSECSIHNETETLTPADTYVVLTECHNAEDPGGQSGYVVVTAQNPSLFDEDWSFDYLVGSEIVINPSGGMYALNAVPFTAGGIPWPGESFGYEPFPAEVIVPSFVAAANSHLTLTAFMADPNDVASISIKGWNDNEQHISATFEMGCWFDLPLYTVADMFTEAHLLGSGHDPLELDINCNGNTIETGWCYIDCTKVETPGGETVDADGVPLLGAITAGYDTLIDGGTNLWERGSEDIADP